MGLFIDCRYAIRNLLKSVKFSLLVLFIIVGSLTISLIGFNFVHTIMFANTDNYETSSDIRILRVKNSITDQRDFTYSMIEPFSDLAETNNLDEWLAIQRTRLFISNGKQANLDNSTYVMPSFFEFIGQQPVMGRGFINDDFKANSPNVVVISHVLWQELYQGTTEILDQYIDIANKSYKIVGVMPKRSNFPIYSKLWLPIKQNTLKPDDDIQLLYKTPSIAFEEDFEPILAEFFLQQIEADRSQSNKEQSHRVKVESLTIVEFNTEKEAIYIFLLFVFGILLIIFISSINIGNLLYARIIERQKESAIRAALGASKYRIIQQHVCEGALLCIFSWVFSLLLTSLSLDFLNFYMNMMFGSKMPYWWFWQLNGLTVLVSILLLVLIFLFAVLLPAFKTVNFNINTVLRDGTRGAAGKQATLMSKRLLCMQVSLISFILMIASCVGYIMYDITQMVESQTYEGSYSVDIRVEQPVLDNIGKQLDIINGLSAKLLSVKSIEDFYLSNAMFTDMKIKNPNGIVLHGNETLHYAQTRLLDRELKTGRNFNQNDNPESKPVVIISSSLAMDLFGNEDVLGKRLDLKNSPWTSAEIIGIANNVNKGLGRDTSHEVYFSLRQTYLSNSYLNLKLITTRSKSEILDDVLNVVNIFGDDLNFNSIFDHYDNNQSMINSFTVLITVFVIVGGFAMTLSLISIYAMGISNINNARYEIGIRRAIGAQDEQILFLFIKKNIAHIFYGLAGALMLFYCLSYMVVGLFKDVIPFSIMFNSGTVMTLIVLLSVCMALYVPVKRVIKEAPATSLRMD